MSQILNNLSAWKLVTGFLNKENVAVPGSPTASPSGSIVQPYQGMVGTKVYLTAAEALALSDTTVGTLYEGMYQFVQVDAGAVASVVVGSVLVWSNPDTYVVTPDVAAGTAGLIAGVALGAITKGNYGVIQVAGKASVLFKNPLTKVAISGDLVVVDSASATGDVLADATTLTSPTAKLILGVALEAPANGAVKKVLLRIGGMGV